MSVADNLNNIRAAIAASSKDAARDPYGVHLVAVSKQQPDARIEEALSTGHRLFGENRVQEAALRWGDRRKVFADLKLHLIGPLQTNKVKEAVGLFDVIETLDREKLARALSDEMQKQNRRLPCFIQVNTGDETQKSGISTAALPAFLEFCRRDCGLDIQGLMCIPPLEEPPALHFGLLAKLARRHELPCLSMGMSGDFEKAIALGATHIRLGTAVFGARDL
jgi:pyridoxal phosphate enzyme (YggS family)